MAASTPARLAGDGGRRTLAAVHDRGLTRRGALALGAAAGAGALLARPLGALARDAAGPRSFGLRLDAADFPDGSGVSRVVRTQRRFHLVGLRGERGDVEVRARDAAGRWSPWVPLAVRDAHAPDTGTGERASDPVWTGGSHELQLRVAGAVPAALRLHLVAVPAVARRRLRPRLHARAAQSGIPAPPPMITRAQWGADSVPPRAEPSYGVVQMGFVHHTVNANAYGPSDSAAIVLAIAKYHRDTNGWNDIGYNFLVDRFGQIFEGRGGGIDKAVIGAQAQGYNSNSTGVAVIGTFESAGIPDAALESVAHILGWKLSLHAVPTEGLVVLESAGGDANRYPEGRLVTFRRISGHRDGCTTSCPGDAAYAQLPAIRRRGRQYAFDVATGAVAQVSLNAEQTSVVYDAPAHLSGIVIGGDGRPAAGQAVLVQRRVGGRWATIAQMTADTTGGWQLSVPWRATADVRAQAGRLSSPATRVLCRPSVVRGRIVRRVSAGGAVRVRGTVQPSVRVYVLVERQGADGRWRRAGVHRASVRAGRFDAAVRLNRTGIYRLTVKAGTPAADGAARPARVVVVPRGGAKR